jgi:hypothetical protein
MALIFLFVLAFGAFAITIVVVQYRARQARVRSLATIARRIGFTFSAADTDHLVDMPFRLFSRGDKRAAELVLSGTHDGIPLRMFDYWYRVDSGKNTTYYRFSCALATIGAACPRLEIGHENFLTRLGDGFGLGDVELEYDEFNRRFQVKCADQRFAFSLLDGEMMQWLLDRDTFESVEVDGPWVLLVRRKLDPAQWLDLGTWIDGFVRHVPAVVFSTYPPR